MSQWRFTGFGRQEFVNFRQFERQTGFVNHIGHTVFVVNREGFTPITLAREDGVAQAEVNFYPSQSGSLDIFFCFGNGFFYGQTIQYQPTFGGTWTWRVHHDTFFGIEAFFTDITTFDQRTDFKTEVFGKRIVATVMCRYGHDSSRTITCQYIITDPYGDSFVCQRVDGIASGEYTAYTAVGNTFAFRTLFSAFKVSIYFCLLSGSSELCHKFTFGGKYHEGYTEYCIGTSGKNGEFNIRIFHFKLHFGTF